MIIIHFCHLSFGFFATGRTHHATCHLHAPESPGTVVLVFITSPLEVISATSAAIAAAKADPAVAAALEGKQLVKEIYVKGRLVNLAVKG